MYMGAQLVVNYHLSATETNITDAVEDTPTFNTSAGIIMQYLSTLSKFMEFFIFYL